jgi:UrcA family protein
VLLTAPLFAEEPMIVRGHQQKVYQERVGFADLDLRQSHDQRTLKTRVRNASERVCLKAEGPFPEYGFALSKDASLTCADLTYNNAKSQISSAIQGVEAGRQVAMALVTSAPSKAR